MCIHLYDVTDRYCRMSPGSFWTHLTRAIAIYIPVHGEQKVEKARKYHESSHETLIRELPILVVLDPQRLAYDDKYGTCP